MAEAKPLASLSGSLLARKGAAKPAMRRQGMAGLGHAMIQPDDLGWNDMGYDANPVQDDRSSHQRIDLTPMLNSVHAARENEEADGEESTILMSAPVPEVVLQRQLLAEKINPRPQAMSLADAIAENKKDAAPAAPEASPEPATEPTALAHDAANDAPVVQPIAQPVVQPSAPSVVTPLTPRPMAAPGIVQGSMMGGQGGLSRVLERTPRRQPIVGNKAAFTLRIDPERHLRLRLASAVTHRSAQVILIEALDTYLKTLPDIDALAHQAAQKK